MTIPPFLLAKLYVKGSLRNTSDGFELDIKNIIDSTSLTAVGPIGADGTSYEAQSVTLTIRDRSWPGGELSEANPAPLPVGVPLTIRVRAAPLAPGRHRVSVAAVSADIGGIAFDVQDAVK
jgi:hypothetical protein